MRIGELAAATGVSTRALRYYEEQLLLASQRSPSGQRHYPDGAVDRVLLIQQLYAAGLASGSIVELLPCVVTGHATPETLGRLSAERARIDTQINTLIRTRDRLDAIITAATTTLETGDPCPDQPSAPGTGSSSALRFPAGAVHQRGGAVAPGGAGV